jgi:mevalonate kinase
LLDAPDIQLKSFSGELNIDHPFRVAIQSVSDFFHLDHYPACEIKISSEVPIAAGLGSSASTAVALIRALIKFLGQSLDKVEVNQLAFNVEKTIHGNPSGVDNTVITYEKPIFFIKNSSIEFLSVQQSMYFVIGNSGIKSLTKETVSQVREKFNSQMSKYELLFDQIRTTTENAKEALISGNLHETGRLMNENHALLKTIEVSSEILDRLVAAAIEAGALGAKLCGSGRGGNMIALLENVADRGKVEQALSNAGATATYFTKLKAG